MTAVRRVIPVCMVLGLVFDPSCNRMMDAQTVEDVMVPMRDGVSLPTRIWRPIEAGVYPAVLTRGYTVGGLGERYYGKLRVSQCFTDAGYVFVDQQCRGEGGAEGGRFFPDDDDGYDCIEWVGRQAWCNGQVAMWGGSYWGATQWRAAVAQPPSLKAIVPGFVNAEHWKQGYRSQGAIHLKMTTQSNRAIPRGTYTLDDWKQMLMYLPLIDMDYEFLGREDPLWNDYISHSCYDDYWKAIGMREGCKYEKVNVPTYIMAGFRDYYAGAAFESYLVLRAVGNVAEIRIHVGDYGHSAFRVPGRDQTTFLEVRQASIDRDVGSVPSRLAGDETPNSIAETLDGISLAVLQEAPVFMTAAASFTNTRVPLRHMKTVRAYQPIVVYAHHNGDPRPAAFQKHRGRDQGKDIVDMDDIGTRLVQKGPEGELGAQTEYPGEERPGPPQEHGTDLRAAPHEACDVVTLRNKQAEQILDGGLFAAVYRIPIMYHRDIHKSAIRRLWNCAASAKQRCAMPVFR